jgi:two-component system, LytTR family, sensor kinase
VQIKAEQASTLGLAPFILMTFVENAFKHVSHHGKQPNWITINLQVDGDRLVFVVANSCSADDTGQAVKYSGIGLKNVQRRLDLLYPGRYELAIDRGTEVFEVRLQLTLTPMESYATELYNR